MEKRQAEAIAQAILEPDLRAQAELRNKRALDAARLARQRRVAVFTLVGCGVGAAVAHFSDVRFTTGVILGGLACAAIGWLVTGRAVGSSSSVWYSRKGGG